MKPKPDTNSDFNHPPLTAEDYERLWNYYKWDDRVIISSNGYACTVSVHFPLQSENDFNKFGFRVRVDITTKDRGQGTIVPPLADTTQKVADRKIWELADFICGIKPKKKG